MKMLKQMQKQSIKLYPFQKKLIEKLEKHLKEGKKRPCVVSPAGSGKTVILSHITKRATDKNNQVLFLVHRQELIEQARNMLIKNNVNMDYVQLGMVQTVSRNLDKVITPKLIITDEAHHGKAPTYKNIYDHFEDVIKIGFTATPIRFGGGGLGDVNDVLVEVVDVNYLIENNYLSPFRYFGPSSIDTSKLNVKGVGEFSDESINDAMEKSKIYGDAVKHYKELVYGEQAIVYCHSVEASINVSETFNNSGINSAHIDGDTPSNERKEIINSFRKGEIKVLSNVDIIGEGFDVPECSVVIMLRPTKSLSLFIQQSMRGMRYLPNKTATIIDHVDNKERHEYPNTPREWTLDGEIKKEQQNELSAKQCDKCFYNYESKHNSCPNCGYVSPIKERDDYEVVEDAKLEEIDTSITLDFEKVVRKTPDECKNMAELYELERKRGYKKGYAYINGKRLGFIK